MKRITKVIFKFTLCCVILSSCLQEEENIDLWETSGKELTFHLNSCEYGETDVAQTRIVEEETRFDRMEYRICGSDGEPVTTVKHIFHPETSTLNIGGLRDGEYYLYLLAVKGNEAEDNVTIASWDNPSAGTWLTVGNASHPLQADYYYSKHPFIVEGGAVTNQDIRLSHICGQVDFQFVWKNNYAGTSVEDITIVPAHSFASSTFTPEGMYDGSNELDSISCGTGDKHIFRLMPNEEGSEFKGEIHMRFRRHNGERIYQKYNFTTVIKPNVREVIRIEASHPDENTGLLWIRNKDYTETNYYTILTDTESKAIYYDHNQRSFYVNTPLQANINAESKLHFRFYSPVAMDSVTLYARLPGKQEYYEFAFIDHIPAFADAVFALPPAGKRITYRTEAGEYKEMDSSDLYGATATQFKIVSNDPYWKKIEQIKPKWYIGFNSFGGDPDRPDGGTAGYWIGIRPVHIREAVALLTNIAYMCSLDSFSEWASTFQGQLKNDAQQVVDYRTVISQLRNLQALNVGLVNGGVYGLGGGYTFGVWQKVFLEHYDNEWAVHTAFHELGHCMGYGHNSQMTYGVWAEGCCNVFYHRNIASFPVNSWSILNSRNNPNKYQL